VDAPDAADDDAPEHGDDRPDDRPTGLRIVLVGQGTKPIPPQGYAPIETHIANLAAALRRRGEDVHVVNRVFPKVRLRLLWHALWAHRQVRRLKADVVHVHSSVNARVLARLGDRPLVFTTHNRAWSEPAARADVHLRRDRDAYVLADARIVLSEQTRQGVGSWPELRDLPSHVIPNGVDTAEFSPPASPSTQRIAVGVGVVDPVKRWHLVAEATAGTGWTFEVVGPILDTAYAGRLRAAGPHVRLHGEVAREELLATLRRARILAHPSAAEGMPLAVLEGMACGLPVVGSTAVRGIVEPGVEGFIVGEAAEAGMVLSWKRILQETSVATWSGMGTKARRTAESRFSWAAVADATLQVYRAAAGS